MSLMRESVRMDVSMPILSAAVSFLSARLDKLGGPWKFPFAGVAIDEARQYSHDKDLAQVWSGCNTAAKEMAIHTLWEEFMLAKIVSHVGCKRLLLSHLVALRDLDPESFIEIAEYFDQILLRRANNHKTLNEFLSQLQTIDDFFLSHGKPSLIQKLLSVRKHDSDVWDNLRQILVNHLPSGESITDISELDHLLRVAAATSLHPSSILLKYFYLGCRYPEQLPDRFYHLSCVVGALTSSSALHRNNEDLVLALRSFVEHICSTTPELAPYSWWHFLFNRAKMSSSEIAAFALAIESVFDKRNSAKSWMETRSSWLHSVMDLINSDDSGPFLMFVTRMAQLNDEFATSTDTVWLKELDFNSVRSCLLRFEGNAFNSGIFTKNWKVQRSIIRFSISNASSLQELCMALLEIERHVETEVFSPDWPRRVALWEFPLLAFSSSCDSTSLETVKNCLLKLADSIPVQFISKEFYTGYRLKWRRQVSRCRYLYPLCELLIDLELGLEFEATLSTWSDYRSQWGLHVHCSYSISTLAQCLLDLERSLVSTLRNGAVWRQRLLDQTLIDEPGRAAVLKRAMAGMLKAIDQVHWRSGFRRSVHPSNTNEQSFFMQLAACRTIDQISLLVTLTAEMLMLPEGKMFSREWFQTVEECHTSFYLSACLIVFDSQLSDSLLRTEERNWHAQLVQVRTWSISNVSVRAVRTILLLLEDHLQPCFMKSTWQTDSAIWRKFCSWQTTEKGIQLAIELLLSNFRMPFIPFDSKSKSAPDMLLILDEFLPESAFNSSWNRVRGLCRISLRQGVPGPMAVAFCLEHLSQNIVEDGRCIGRVFGDIPSSIVQMKGTLLALQSSVDFSPIESTWSEHYEYWLDALEMAKQPEDLAMPMLTFAAFFESLPSTYPYRLSICFRQLREIWEHTLLDVVKPNVPSFLIEDEVPVLLSQSDLEFSRNRRIDMSYDRILPVGLYRVLDAEHANIMSANSFTDLGMGTGLAVLQVFCNSSSAVLKCIGVEASTSRFRRAIQTTKANVPGEILMQTSSEFIAASQDQRMLILRCGDLFECEDGIASDVVLLFVSLTPAMHRRLCKFVLKMRPGSRLITKFNISSMFEKLSLGDAPFRQIPVNCLESDRFLLQSCPSSGQHLYVFVKI